MVGLHMPWDICNEVHLKQYNSYLGAFKILWVFCRLCFRYNSKYCPCWYQLIGTALAYLLINTGTEDQLEQRSAENNKL